jgi:nicotinate-nucleotide adenylyltransferase
MQRIGLFGGSFDPVHNGHLLVALAACEELNLSRLYFIPAAQSPFKPANTPAPAQERLKLLHLALVGFTNYEVDDQEIRRGAISYSIDTVRVYAGKFGDAQLFYLIGADHIAQLPKWRESEQLTKMVEFVVIPRPGEVPAELPSPYRLRHLRGFPFAVSSSQIRSRIKAGQSIEALVPPAVAEAIHNSRLYL